MKKSLPPLDGPARDILIVARHLIASNNGVRPTRRDIALAAGLRHASNVDYHWAKLVHDGYIGEPVDDSPTKRRRVAKWWIIADENGELVRPYPRREITLDDPVGHLHLDRGDQVTVEQRSAESDRDRVWAFDGGVIVEVRRSRT